MSKNGAVSSKPSKVMRDSSNENLIYIVPKPVYSFFKRLFDIIFSVVTLSVLIVPMSVLALIIVIDSPGASPIYSQERVGKNGKRFKFYKFRSMIPDADKMIDELMDKNEMDGPAFKIKDDPRITRVGKFIRSSSIDELPQLWNVLIGDMSLVGPRPPLLRELAQYTNYDKQRLLITPGCTGLWQVSGRSSLTFHDMVRLDLEYIIKRSLWLDIKIILKTVLLLVGSRNAY